MKRYKEVQQLKDFFNKKEPQYFMIINFKELKQRVWGDFRIKIEGKASFYFWLNVSAIIHNSQIKQISLQRQKENPGLPPLHFDSFQEFDESSFEDKSKF